MVGADLTRHPELTTAYALTAVLGIVGLTLLPVAGYQRYEERAD